MTTPNETPSKAPTHQINVVVPKEGTDKSDWFNVGVAWEHSDQNGLNLSINPVGVAYLSTKGAETILKVRRNKPQE